MAAIYSHPDETENKHDRFLDAGQEPRRMLQPIEGYQNLPLVSLEEAVESIVICCPDIRRRVYIAMSNCENPADGLNQDESASIYLYTMEWEPREECLYYVLNKTLRTENRQKLKPWFPYLKLILIALHKLPPQRKTIWRGVTLDLNQEYQIGKRYVWWAFSSCTESLVVLESDLFLGKDGPRTLFSIECQNGKMIRLHSSVDVEDEILLLPATQFEVKSKLNPSPNLYIIHLKQVESPFLLIESPSVNPTPDVQSSYRNVKLEKLIVQYSLKDAIDLSRQELTDIDIPIVVQQAIIGKKCSELKIGKNNITAQGAEHLAQALKSNTSLQELDLRNNQVSDAGVRWIAQALHTNSTLTVLSLHRNQIGSEGARFLAEALRVNSTLKQLRLWANETIGDSGTQHLAQALTRNTTLTQLDLDKNAVTDEGITHLAEMLKRNSTLKDLDISDNPLTDKGVQTLMNVLCNNHGLQRLEIRCSKMTGKSLVIIQNMFEQNKTLSTLLVPAASFSSEEQKKLQAIAETKNRQIKFD